MIIKVSKDLKRQDIYANGGELASIMGKDRVKGKRILDYLPEKKMPVHSFKNPILMTDNARISKLKPTLRDTLFSLYSMRPRIIEYDGISVFWDHSHMSVWCPSIDTLLFAKALRSILKRKIKYAIEIGCGSGFLSKFVLAKNKNIRSMIVNDLNPYALKCAVDNIKDKRAEFIVGDGIEKIRGKKFDLMICNPPYVPRKESIDDNPYEGIGLLDYLVHEGQKYLNKNGIMVINISSLCWKMIMKKKPKMRMHVLQKMHVPLKVNNILNNPAWLRYLKKCGLKKGNSSYDYWQELNIVLLENNSC